MKKNYIIILLYLLFVISCAGIDHFKNADAFVDISNIRNVDIVSYDNAENIVQQYTIDFKIPNPLFGGTETRLRKTDPKHEDTIYCRATLLDDFSTEADILKNCPKDTLEEESCKECRKRYVEQHMRNGMFRIRVSLESGFSLKSMETDHWAMYIENARGIMIEPEEIVASQVTTLQDSTYSNYYRINLPRSLLYRDITLYFKQRTFFGEDLLGEDNPFIVFIMSHEQKTVARVVWNISKIENN